MATILRDMVARALWLKREERFPQRVRRPPDVMDGKTGAWAYVFEDADAALTAIKAMPDECLDRAAKVAFHVGGFGDVEWSTIDEFNRNLWRENARDIITAALSDSEATP